DAMEEACIIGLQKGSKEFKTHIDLYMNSKYARKEYLPTDTKNGSVASFAIIEKYMTIIKTEKGELNNLKHLRGAATRLRIDSSENFVFILLKAFSVFLLEKENVGKAIKLPTSKEIKEFLNKPINTKSEYTYINHIEFMIENTGKMLENILEENGNDNTTDKYRFYEKELNFYETLWKQLSVTEDQPTGEAYIVIGFIQDELAQFTRDTNENIESRMNQEGEIPNDQDVDSDVFENDTFDEDFYLTINLMDKMKVRLKVLLSNIYKRDAQGNLIRTWFGPDFEDADSILHTTISIISESDALGSYSKIKEKLLEPNTLKAFPYLKQMLNKLDAATEQERNEFVTLVSQRDSSPLTINWNTKGGQMKVSINEANRNSKWQVGIDNWRKSLINNNIITFDNEDKKLKLNTSPEMVERMTEVVKRIEKYQGEAYNLTLKIYGYQQIKIEDTTPKATTASLGKVNTGVKGTDVTITSIPKSEFIQDIKFVFESFGIYLSDATINDIANER
ncbi:MAG: hypothetical protein GW823_12015, partial [Bacteroidetes bacterium]|nr:hypothetical protein [Bacteroidota bacterium]